MNKRYSEHTELTLEIKELLSQKLNIYAFITISGRVGAAASSFES